MSTMVKEHVRDVRVGAWLDALRQDVRFGVRTLIRRPGFATVAVLTLGVGMGATTAIFSLIDSVLLKPLPFHEPERLTMVWEVRPRFNQPRIEVAPLNYVDWQQQVQAFESLAAYVNGFVNLTGAGTPERLAAAQVTPNLFPTLGVDPLVGRWFVAPEGAPGQTAVAILSYGLWQRRFGADRGIVGQTIRLDGQPHLVVGVMPRGFQFPRQDVQVMDARRFSRGLGCSVARHVLPIRRWSFEAECVRGTGEHGAPSRRAGHWPRPIRRTSIPRPLPFRFSRI